MKMYKVPAISVAIIDNFKIDWAKGYGMTDAGGASPISTGTLFQAASISKPVTSAAALYLFERGMLSAPSRAMADELLRLSEPHVREIYPPIGETANDGHNFLFTDVPRWKRDVFAFLDGNVRR